MFKCVFVRTTLDLVPIDLEKSRSLFLSNNVKHIHCSCVKTMYMFRSQYKIFLTGYACTISLLDAFMQGINGHIFLF